MKKLLLSALLLAAGATAANAQSLEVYIGTEYETVLNDEGKKVNKVTNYKLISEGDVINTPCHIDAVSQYKTVESKAYILLKNKSDLPLNVKIETTVAKQELSKEAQELMEVWQGSYAFCIFGACRNGTEVIEGTIPAYGQTAGGTGEDIAYNFTLFPDDAIDLSQITYDVKNDYKITTDDNDTLNFSVTFNSSATGIDSIEAGNTEAVYYNLQGIRVSNPEKGQLYIVRTGDKTSKVVF